MRSIGRCPGPLSPGKTIIARIRSVFSYRSNCTEGTGHPGVSHGAPSLKIHRPREDKPQRGLIFCCEMGIFGHVGPFCKVDHRESPWTKGQPKDGNTKKLD